MKTVTVELGNKAYPIHIGPGALREPQLLRKNLGPTAVVVTDTRVAPLYLDTLRQSLGDAAGATVILPEGEKHKTMASVLEIIDTLTKAGCGRDTTLIALGGGVIGDMTGFAAAIYQRGISFVQVPTTLLAQVDASVGGKTAVNHPRGKNLIGAFHQPRCVISDTATLATLDPRQFRSGLAEVIKHALLADATFFDWLEAHMTDLLSHDAAALDHAIARCCEIKAAVVARDEHEHGLRALLNLGHTFAHAIESESGFSWLHGEAVGAGLVLAARLSAHSGSFDKALVPRIQRLVAAAGLPTNAAGLSVDALQRWMLLDKKARAGRTRFVLMDRIGAARLDANIPADAVDTVLRVAAD